MHVAAAVGALDPMFPYTQYYDLSNCNIDTFIKIRFDIQSVLHCMFYLLNRHGLRAVEESLHEKIVKWKSGMRVGVWLGCIRTKR